jgi:hypothetical protein
VTPPRPLVERPILLRRHEAEVGGGGKPSQSGRCSVTRWAPRRAAQRRGDWLDVSAETSSGRSPCQPFRGERRRSQDRPEGSLRATQSAVLGAPSRGRPPQIQPPATGCCTRPPDTARGIGRRPWRERVAQTHPLHSGQMLSGDAASRRFPVFVEPGADGRRWCPLDREV